MARGSDLALPGPHGLCQGVRAHDLRPVGGSPQRACDPLIDAVVLAIDAVRIHPPQHRQTGGRSTAWSKDLRVTAARTRSARLCRNGPAASGWRTSGRWPCDPGWAAHEEPGDRAGRRHVSSRHSGEGAVLPLIAGSWCGKVRGTNQVILEHLRSGQSKEVLTLPGELMWVKFGPKIAGSKIPSFPLR
jgi:hypothetical protein